MVKLIFTKAGKEDRVVDVEIGITVMEAAQTNGVAGILGDCGGALSCATCHVHIHPDWLERVGVASELENEMLELAIDPDEFSRLSCQIVVSDELDGAQFIIPPTQV